MPEPTLEQWLDLHQAFREYCEAAPWRWFDDGITVAIQHPSEDYKGYCVVLGGGGMEYGLAVYNGDEGLICYLRSLSGEIGSDTPEILDSLNALSAMLADREHLNKADRDVIRSIGLRYRGRGNWPMFRSTRPGYAPWPLEADEAKFLSMALRNVTELAGQADGGNFPDPPHDDLILILTRSLRNGQWHERWESPTVPPAPVIPDYPDAERLQQLAGSTGRTSDEWELGIFHLYAPMSEEKGERPYFPVVATIAGPGSPLMLPECFNGPNPSATERQELLVKLLEKAPALPSGFSVDSHYLAELVEPVTSPLGIQVSVQETPYIRDMQEALSNFF